MEVAMSGRPVLFILLLSAFVALVISSSASAQQFNNHSAWEPYMGNKPAVYCPQGVRDLNDGIAAYRRDDYAHAVSKWKLAASQGCAAAAYNLGALYFRGENVPANRPLGTAWMSVAAEYGTIDYQRSHDRMASSLDTGERAQYRTDYQRLQLTYGKAVTLHPEGANR
jgi:TPR repeat protein